VASLKQQVDDSTAWTRVGANAELVAWPRLQLKHCPYALDVALERFYTGTTLKHSALFHFGTQPVTEQLPGWFEQYNGRQTTLAGIKESKQVFSLHHLKVRSEPAIYLQEAFVVFAANFIRWAAHWLEGQAQPAENALNVHKLGVKRQVRVAAHVSAQVIQDRGRQVVKVQRAERLCRPTAQSRRRWMIAAPTPILKISAIFQRIASDCTTVTLA
jgi:hypothetical protein